MIALDCCCLASQRGVVDPAPVKPDSLFQLFGAGSTLLATLALQEAHRGGMRLDAPVAAAWEAFGSRGKDALTLAQLLSHQTGLGGAMVGAAPEKAPLDVLCDVNAMAKFIASVRHDAEAENYH